MFGEKNNDSVMIERLLILELLNRLKVLGFVLDTKLLFKSPIRSIAASVSIKVGIMRKALCLLSDPILDSRRLWSYL